MEEIQIKVKQIEAYANRIVSMKKIVDDCVTSLGREIQSLAADLQRARDHRGPAPTKPENG